MCGKLKSVYIGLYAIIFIFHCDFESIKFYSISPFWMKSKKQREREKELNDAFCSPSSIVIHPTFLSSFIRFAFRINQLIVLCTFPIEYFPKFVLKLLETVELNFNE